MVRDFIWDSGSGDKKLSLVKWNDTCQPTTHEGKSVLSLRNLNKAFLMKVGFNIITKLHLLWVKILRHKYKWDLHYNASNTIASCSHL